MRGAHGAAQLLSLSGAPRTDPMDVPSRILIGAYLVSVIYFKFHVAPEMV
jgi:hypothetical protein